MNDVLNQLLSVFSNLRVKLVNLRVNLLDKEMDIMLLYANVNMVSIL